MNLYERYRIKKKIKKLECIKNEKIYKYKQCKKAKEKLSVKMYLSEGDEKKYYKAQILKINNEMIKSLKDFKRIRNQIKKLDRII